MKGVILGLDAEQNAVIILDRNDKRYRLPKSEWKSAREPQVGMAVDFVTAGEDLAKEAYFIPTTVEKQDIASFTVKAKGMVKQFKKLPFDVLFGVGLALAVALAVVVLAVLINHISDCNKATITTNDVVAAGYYNSAKLKEERFDLDGAIADYTKIIKLSPKYKGPYLGLGFSVYDWRGLANEKKGNLDGAIGDYTKAIKLNWDKSYSYARRGQAKEQIGDLDGALADFKMALKLDPNDAAAYYGRSLVKKAKGDLDGALADYNKAVEINPFDVAYAYYNSGQAKEYKGDLAGALADFNMALKLSPRYVDAQKNVDELKVRMAK
jgi:tetratricopeptide (TPR) repeat protein